MTKVLLLLIDDMAEKTLLLTVTSIPLLPLLF